MGELKIATCLARRGTTSLFTRGKILLDQDLYWDQVCCFSCLALPLLPPGACSHHAWLPGEEEEHGAGKRHGSQVLKEVCHGQDQLGPQTLQMAKWEIETMVEYIIMGTKFNKIPIILFLLKFLFMLREGLSQPLNWSKFSLTTGLL